MLAKIDWRVGLESAQISVNCRLRSRFYLTRVAPANIANTELNLEAIAETLEDVAQKKINVGPHAEVRIWLRTRMPVNFNNGKTLVVEMEQADPTAATSLEWEDFVTVATAHILDALADERYHREAEVRIGNKAFTVMELEGDRPFDWPEIVDYEPYIRTRKEKKS